MKKKQGNLKAVFLVFILAEVILVILSGSFRKKLEFGFEKGRFVVRNAPARFDLQEKITVDFQKDEFLLQSCHLKSYEVKDFNKLRTELLSSHQLMKKAYSFLKSDTKRLLQENDLQSNVHRQGQLINDINESIIINEHFIEKDYLELLSENDEETEYLKKEFISGRKLSPLDRNRLNRLLLQSRLSPAVISPQQNLPRIYNNFRLYDFFRRIFGEKSALSAFYLLRMLLIIDLIFIFMIIFIRKGLAHHPSRSQLVIEMIYNTFDDFVKDTVGKDRTHFTPYIVSLFLFLLISNIIGLIPIPGFMEPTRNLNVPLGLGIVVIIVVHFTAFRVKGIWGHLENYVNPVKNPLAALDVVSEVSKVVSIAFRLFGNILGGAIIIVVVSSLVNFVILPVGLNLFFGIFVGTIQAFVFTMLALTYIGVEITE